MMPPSREVGQCHGGVHAQRKYRMSLTGFRVLRAGGRDFRVPMFDPRQQHHGGGWARRPDHGSRVSRFSRRTRLIGGSIDRSSSRDRLEAYLRCGLSSHRVTESTPSRLTPLRGIESFFVRLFFLFCFFVLFFCFSVLLFVFCFFLFFLVLFCFALFFCFFVLFFLFFCCFVVLLFFCFFCFFCFFFLAERLADPVVIGAGPCGSSQTYPRRVCDQATDFRREQDLLLSSETRILQNLRTARVQGQQARPNPDRDAPLRISWIYAAICCSTSLVAYPTSHPRSALDERGGGWWRDYPAHRARVPFRIRREGLPASARF